MITVSITKFPGETRMFKLQDGATVGDAATMAGVSLENQEIRVNEEMSTAGQELEDDDDILISKAVVSQV
jgi:hypothetical protein